MSIEYLALAALVPILLALVLMVGLRWSAVVSMPLAWIATILVAIIFYQQQWLFVLASTLAGFGSALNVIIIVFGALVILYTLQESGAMFSITTWLKSISGDRRIQVLIIAFMFSAFLEGAAGFGTPAAIAAPLLLSMGFPAIAAVLISLILNSFPVSFGAAGTPIWYGLNNLKDPVEATGGNFSIFLDQVGQWAVIFHALMIYILPLLVLGMMTRFYGARKSWREGLGAWKFSLFASTSFLVPYMATAFLLGEEFPSIFGGAIGLALTIWAAKKGWFQPRQTWDFPEQSSWPSHWMGTIKAVSTFEAKKTMHLGLALTPYLLIGLILVVTRIRQLDLFQWLQGWVIDVKHLLGFQGVGFNIKPLFLPGVVPFILVALLTIPLQRMSLKMVSAAWRQSILRLKGPVIALFFAVALVEVFKQTGQNALGYPSMPLALADVTAKLTGSLWPLFAPLVGAIGSFITGSNTVSDLLFADFQWGVAEKLQITPVIVVALQVVGGAMGNMVCVHNIVAASATVGLIGMEGKLIKQNSLPLFLYALIVGLLGLFFIYVYTPAI